MLKRKRIYIGLLVVLIVGLLIPQRMVIPVQGASSKDWNSESFWYYPWGKSVTHKGIDIFAEEGKPVLASTIGIVLFSGEMGRGGNAVIILGPKWRFHYYAHLKSIDVRLFRPVRRGREIGSVGRTGNAASTPPHLHYSIITPIPYFWRIDGAKQGWKKIFYLNPDKYLEKNET
jgi:murein DD-endopeptidase MepM/ murein hydrolase activator NlpD